MRRTVARTAAAQSVYGALGDWHPFGGAFRIGAGLSGVDASGTFAGSPASGTTIAIGGASVPVGPGDRYEVTARLPSAMPYLGIGWGASTGLDPEAELERELRTARETAADVEVVPVVSIGLGYRW
jgi:hypothetical protein